MLDIETICLVNDYNEFAHYATIGLLSRNFKGDINFGDSKEQVEYLWSNIENLPKNICKSSIEIINRYKENVFYKRKEI